MKKIVVVLALVSFSVPLRAQEVAPPPSSPSQAGAATSPDTRIKTLEDEVRTLADQATTAPSQAGTA